MKTILQFALLLMTMNLTAQQDFSKLKWRSRVLLLSTSTLSSEGYNAQMEAFLKSPKKLEDRNLLIFTLVKGKIYDKESKALPYYDVMALRKKYDLSTSYEGLVLIGKDGSTKLKKTFSSTAYHDF